MKDTNTFIFTFNTSVLPKQVKVAFLRVSVDAYIPNPLRCYQCQLFGHHEDKCKNKYVSTVVNLNIALMTKTVQM